MSLNNDAPHGWKTSATMYGTPSLFQKQIGGSLWSIELDNGKWIAYRDGKSVNYGFWCPDEAADWIKDFVHAEEVNAARPCFICGYPKVLVKYERGGLADVISDPRMGRLSPAIFSKIDRYWWYAIPYCPKCGSAGRKEPFKAEGYYSQEFTTGDRHRRSVAKKRAILRWNGIDPDAKTE